MAENFLNEPLRFKLCGLISRLENIKRVTIQCSENSEHIKRMRCIENNR